MYVIGDERDLIGLRTNHRRDVTFRTTNIVRHVNAIAPRRIPFSMRLVIPAYADSLAHDIGLIDSGLPLEKLRETHRIDGVAQRAGIDAGFSRVIRRRTRPRPS